jgi:hypothetical protein
VKEHCKYAPQNKAAARLHHNPGLLIAVGRRREFITSVLMAIAGLFAFGILVLIASLIVSALF